MTKQVLTQQRNSSKNQEDKSSKQMSSRILYLLPLAIFACLACLALWGLGSGRSGLREIPSALISKPVPVFTLEALPGLKNAEGVDIPSFSAEDFKGKVSVINVWASWCVACRQEHDSLIQLSKDTNLRLFGLNYRDTPENALKMLQRGGNPYEAVGVDPKGKAGIEWGVYGVPETFIVDAKGVIRYKHIGPIFPSQLEEFRKKVLAASAEEQ